MGAEVKVGDVIWRFDTNHRVYKRPANMRDPEYGVPIYRAYWVPVHITGETTRSWITVYGKVPKHGKEMRRAGWALTQQAVDEDCWVEHHMHRLQRAMSCSLSKYNPGVAERMRAIMAAIDYKEEGWK